MTRRIGFCGSINGTVTVRDGETEEEAIERAQNAILDALTRSCKRLGLGDGNGPNVGLEIDVTYADTN